MKYVTSKINVELSGAETDDDLGRIADENVPAIVANFGNQIGEQAWADASRRLPLDKSGRAKFIRDMATETAQKLSASERADLRADIIEQLKTQRDEVKN